MRVSTLTLSARCRWATPRDGRRRQRPEWGWCRRSGGVVKKKLPTIVTAIQNPHFLNQKQRANDSCCRKLVAAFCPHSPADAICQMHSFNHVGTDKYKRLNTPKKPRLCQTLANTWHSASVGLGGCQNPSINSTVIIFLRQTASYLRVEDKVFGRAHVLGVRVRLEVDAGGVKSVRVARDGGGHVGAGEIHVGVVGRLVQSRHVGAVYAEV